jgi:hypothetical protein
MGVVAHKLAIVAVVHNWHRNANRVDLRRIPPASAIEADYGFNAVAVISIALSPVSTISTKPFSGLAIFCTNNWLAQHTDGPNEFLARLYRVPKS